MATWEHIDNNPKNLGLNVVLCCGSCNSSKGAKKLNEWFKSEYCEKGRINEKTVAATVKNWLKGHKSR